MLKGEMKGLEKDLNLFLDELERGVEEGNGFD